MKHTNKKQFVTFFQPARRMSAGLVLILVGISLIWLARVEPADLMGSMAGTPTDPNCGPESLSTVLNHHGIHPPLDEVIRRSHTTATGTSLLALRDCARSYGLRAEGWQFSQDDLEQIPLPAVVFIDGKHFTVLDSISEDSVRILDPDFGAFSITRDHFFRRWKGFTLVIESIERS